MVASKPFINLLRRATHCGFKQVLMNNRMFMQCYNLDIDSDVGFHYLLYIPETEEYMDPFYDMMLLLEPRPILTQYTAGHRKLDAVRKADGGKTKDLNEEFVFQDKGKRGFLKFMYYYKDELVHTEECEVEWPVDMRSTTIENIEKTYTNLLSRIRPGGACLLIDGLRLNLQQRAVECPEIYFYNLRYHGKVVPVPIAKSMFLGIKEVDAFLISVQESTMPNTYIYSFQLTKKKITEQFFGFIITF